jgi:hypothetical protein
MEEPRRLGAAGRIIALSLAMLAIPGLQVDGAVVSYSQKEIPYGVLVFHRAGMYSPADAPQSRAPGNGRSKIKFDLNFVRFDDGVESFDGSDQGSVEVAVMTESEFERVGYVRDATASAATAADDALDSADGEGGGKNQALRGARSSLSQRIFCCDARAIEDGACTEVGTLIHRDPETLPFYRRIVLPPLDVVESGAGVGRLRDALHVERTGLYLTLVAGCDPRTGTVQVNGAVSWVNPFGYLPGEQFWCMPFFGWASAAYLLAACLWFLALAAHWRDLLAVHASISGLLLLGAVEVLFKHLYYERFNVQGVPNTALLVAGVSLNCAKRTLSRALVLVVAMGWGIVRPSLGFAAYKVAVFSAVYGLFSLAEHLVDNLSRAAAPPLAEYLLMVPLAALDAAFLFWIFRSLLRTIIRLDQRGQTAKLALYRSFERVLALSAALSVLMSVLNVYAVISGWLVGHWYDNWTFKAGWHALYFFLLAAMMVLWRPSQHSRKYAYRSQVPRVDAPDEDGEFGLEMQGRTKDSPHAKFARGVYDTLGLDEDEGEDDAVGNVKTA